MSVTTFKNKIWKKSRSGLFIFGFLHLLFEQIIGSRPMSGAIDSDAVSSVTRLKEYSLL